ncbi:MAG: hypothetical protein NVS3B26_16580 [Mycobacteriales bacterium]
MASVELFGESFGIEPDGFSDFALMEFTSLGREAEEAQDAAGQSKANYDFILDIIVEQDRARFRKAARKARASMEQMGAVVEAAVALRTGRPTGEPSVSSDGPTSISPKSESVSERAARLLPGRPDLQVATVRDAERMAAVG